MVNKCNLAIYLKLKLINNLHFGLGCFSQPSFTMKLLAFLNFISLLSILGCSRPEKEGLLDLDLIILSSDTLVLDVGNVLLQNSKGTLFNDNKELLIQHGRHFFWIETTNGRIQYSLDLDTTSLVLPEVSLVYGQPLEDGKSLALYFPQRSRVVHIDSNPKITKELTFEGLNKIDHALLPYDQNFFFHPVQKDYYMGMMSSKSNSSMDGFLFDTKFIGVFDGFTGKLKYAFGEFSEERKALPSMVLSSGIFHTAWFGGDLYLRETVGTPLISRYNALGDLKESIKMGTSLLNYDLYPFEGGDLWTAKQSDNQMGFSVIEDGLVASNHMTFNEDQENGKGLYDYGVLLLEDFQNRRAYSVKIQPFQRLVGGDKDFLYLLRNHPETDDLVLIKLEYEFGTTVE